MLTRPRAPTSPPRGLACAPGAQQVGEHPRRAVPARRRRGARRARTACCAGTARPTTSSRSRTGTSTSSKASPAGSCGGPRRSWSSTPWGLPAPDGRAARRSAGGVQRAVAHRRDALRRHDARSSGADLARQALPTTTTTTTTYAQPRVDGDGRHADEGTHHRADRDPRAPVRARARAGVVRPGPRAAELNGSAANPRVDRGREDLPARRDPLVERHRARPVDPDAGSSTYPWRRIYPFGGAHLRRGRLQLDPLRHRRDRVRVQRLARHRTASPRSASGTCSARRESSDTVRSRSSVPLQQVAARALAGRDGAVVAIDPRNGAVLAMYSNPTYDPAPLTSLSSADPDARRGSGTTPTTTCTSRRSATSRPRRPSRRGPRSRS